MIDVTSKFLLGGAGPSISHGRPPPRKNFEATSIKEICHGKKQNDSKS